MPILDAPQVARILVVDDDRDILALVRFSLAELTDSVDAVLARRT